MPVTAAKAAPEIAAAESTMTCAGWVAIPDRFRERPLMSISPDPLTSNFSCCLRLDDLDGFYAACQAAGLPETCWGHPRLHAPKIEDSGLRIGALIDPDGTLVRLIQN